MDNSNLAALTDLGPLAWEALEALTAHYGPAINHAAEGLGIPYGEWYGWLMAARIFEPDPVSAPRLHVRAAYTSPATLDAHLAKGMRLGFLESAGDGEYRLTPAGHAAVEHLISTARDAMAGLRPLPEAELERLAALLNTVVQAMLAAPEPPGKWCLRIERHYDPGEAAPVMTRLDQYLSDLNAYRDDSHLAAWRPYEVSGHVWETFTLLWLGEVSNLNELQAKLARRGYGRDEYADALQKLISRGWAVEEGQNYRLTEQGQTLREEAEAVTDRYFYLPWTCLDDAQVDELRDLLVRFRDGLTRR